MIKKMIDKTMATIFPTTWKRHSELKYWKKRKIREKSLSNTHYEFYYTEHFGFSKEFYSNKRILDIGCGPRGSLEWADNALQRIGLDPLADQYLKLGAKYHSMEYRAAPSEAIPFENEHFDVVCSFNSLDHVDNLQKTISEIIRVTKSGGYFLLIVESNHEPTSCEPHKIEPVFYKKLLPDFDLQSLQLYQSKPKTGLYELLKQENIIDKNPENVADTCLISAKFSRT